MRRRNKIEDRCLVIMFDMHEALKAAQWPRLLELIAELRVTAENAVTGTTGGLTTTETHND